MAGFEGLLTPGASTESKSVDGKKVSSDGSSAPKEGPSLFDSMLAQVSKKGTSTGTEEKTSADAKTTTQNTNPSSSNAGATNTPTQNTGTSLFDKMVSETKQQTQVTGTAQNNNGKSTNNIASDVNKVISSTKVGEQLSSEVKTDVKTQTINVTPQTKTAKQTATVVGGEVTQTQTPKTQAQTQNTTNVTPQTKTAKPTATVAGGEVNQTQQTAKTQAQITNTTNVTSQTKPTKPTKPTATVAGGEVTQTQTPKTQAQTTNTTTVTPQTKTAKPTVNVASGENNQTQIAKPQAQTTNTTNVTAQTQTAKPTATVADGEVTQTLTPKTPNQTPNQTANTTNVTPQTQTAKPIATVADGEVTQTLTPKTPNQTANTTNVTPQTKTTKQTSDVTNVIPTTKSAKQNPSDSSSVVKPEVQTSQTKQTQSLGQNINNTQQTNGLIKNSSNKTVQSKNENVDSQTQNLQKLDTGLSTTVSSKDTNEQNSTSQKTAIVQNNGSSTTSKDTSNLSSSQVQNKELNLNSSISSKEKSANVLMANKKADQEPTSKLNNSADAPKKSLADNLISAATATALANKTGESNDSGVKGLDSSNLNQKQTTTIAQSNVPTNLSAGDTAQTSQNLVDSTVTQDIKTNEQNIVDRKVETKNLDIKNSDQKHEIIKSEKDHSLRTSGNTSPTISASTGVNSTPTSNQELASGLASIRDTAKGEVTAINDNNLKSTLKEGMKKDDELKAAKKQENSNSLLDKMMKDATSSTASENKLASESLGAKDQFVQKDLPLFATAGYLHDQKKRNDIANMMKKSEGVKLAQEAKNVGDVKNSAQTLGLNVTETEVIEDVVQKEEVRVQNSRDDLLKRMAFDNNVGRKLHNVNNQVQTNENIVAKSAALTSSTEEQVVEVAVSAEATQTIENRIIGARQTLRSMMSDVARQMAQNYKPPLTAFRINLNPNGLGNIAVMIKSDQNNGISISLNMSNTNTLETFVDNQSQLRAALTRNFDTSTTFNLDFGMQQDSGSNQNQNDGSNQKQNNGSRSTNGSNIVAEQQHTTEEVIAQTNYM